MTFRLRDAELPLELTMREAIEYERRTGRSFFADAQSVADRPTAEVLIGLLWACLLRASPHLALDDVASAISLADLPRVAEALREVFALPFGDPAGAGQDQDVDRLRG